MNQNWKSLALIGVVSSVVTLGGVKLLGGFDNSHDVFLKEAATPTMNRFTSDPMSSPSPLVDFTYAAEISTPAVVHIKSTMRQESRGGGGMQDMLDMFGGDMFGGRGGGRGNGGSQKAESSGSGVIISPDGYIVTNNHVVEGAEELEVVMSDKRSFKAKVIGTDPSTDIAVIQIPAKNLAALTFGNSDAIKVGEWVVAVGNPFNLESTVTAGIVSAKGRGLGIIGQKQDPYSFGRQQRKADMKDTPLESFIQTDAVVNPGNSGGALVNLRGELIGINTAIASPTGSFAGYAFAVPATLVKKVSADLIKFGNVQRGYIGLVPVELDSKKAEELDVKRTTGIYVQSFGENGSAAKDAGVKVGDVITKVDGVEVTTDNKFRELIGLKRPNESVKLSVERDGQMRDINVTLRNREGGKEIIKTDETETAMASLGAQFQDLNTRERQMLQRYKIEGGVKLSQLENSKLARFGLEEGFVVTHIDEKPVKSVKELKAALADKKGTRIQLQGTYIDEPENTFSFTVVL